MNILAAYRKLQTQLQRLQAQIVPNSPVFSKLGDVKAVVMDVDGILTDCRIWLDANGNWCRAFTVRDGIGIKQLLRAGYKVGWITGSKSVDIEQRAKMLGISFLADGQETKEAAFQDFLDKQALSAHEVAYIGDDLPDLPLFELAGFSATVPDAITEAIEAVDYVTLQEGGKGAARELCDLVLTHGYFARSAKAEA